MCGSVEVWKYSASSPAPLLRLPCVQCAVGLKYSKNGGFQALMAIPMYRPTRSAVSEGPRRVREWAKVPRESASVSSEWISVFSYTIHRVGFMLSLVQDLTVESWRRRMTTTTTRFLDNTVVRNHCSCQRRGRLIAGVSQTSEFDCPEEFGYYSHPSDCTQYYVCVFGGALLESCTGGLMYRRSKCYSEYCESHRSSNKAYNSHKTKSI
uniref:Chitin-binding type-2 domain-containing protein n=1 Tax=Timema bartmani TaxID=61472 RepID=A0A7R9F0W1_9NEOP|nr:unnamed protein product [Timema bartmani]